MTATRGMAWIAEAQGCRPGNIQALCRSTAPKNDRPEERSGKVEQAAAEKLGIDAFESGFNIVVGTFPDGHR